MADVLISILRQAQDDRGKAFSNLSVALCGGLLAAGAARAWEIGTMDGTVAVWLLAALGLGFLGWSLLAFLVPED